jgi:putative serine/threonine protein kinase
LRAANNRIAQLEELGVKEIIFEGRTKIGRLNLIGLGTVSVVVKSVTDSGIYALKIRRMDANRESMKREAELTKLANRIGVGPLFIKSSSDFILMQQIEGREIDEWLNNLHGKGTRGRERLLIHKLLNQCRMLDIINLDHGQLSNLRKHVIVSSDKPYIIDFESASTKRTPRNVTTATQYLLIGGKISTKIRRILGIKIDDVLKALKDYKSDMNDINYAKILNSIRIGLPKL